MTTLEFINLSFLIIGTFISCALISIANDINMFRKNFNEFLEEYKKNKKLNI